jgi:hypothetical protein
MLLALCYIGYDLEEPLPDHSNLTKIRTRYGFEVFRRFFQVSYTNRKAHLLYPFGVIRFAS